MAKNTLELQTNPKYVARLNNDETRERVDCLDKKIKRYEKLSKIIDPAVYTTLALFGVGSVAAIIGNTASLAAVANVGFISLGASAVSSSAIAMGAFARIHADGLKLRDR